MSRRRSRINRGFWSCRIPFRKRRLKISSCSSPILCPISSSVMSRIFSALSSLISAPRQILPLDELRPHRQLARAQFHRLLRQLRGDSLELEEDAPRLHDRHPVLGRALALAHSRLRRLHRHRLVRKDAYPHLAAALDEARDRDARRLDLAVRDPRRLERLKPELAEGDGRAAVGHALPAPPHLLPVLDPLRYEHAALSRGRRRGAGLAGRKDRWCLLLVQHLSLEDPHLHAHRPVDRPGRGAREIDIGAQRVKRHASLAVSLGPRHLGAPQAAGAHDAYAPRARAHRRGDRLLHRAPEGDTLLELARDVLRNQDRVEIRLLHFVDIEEDLLLRDVLKLIAKLIHLLTPASDDEPGTRGRNIDRHLGDRPLDDDPRDPGLRETPLQIPPNEYVLFEELRIIL